MKFNPISIVYNGFNPSSFVRSYVDDLVHEIHQESPSGSTLKATLFKKEKRYKGTLNIYSGAGQFFAIAEGTNLRTVSEKILEQIRKQLSRWRSKRFQTAPPNYQLDKFPGHHSFKTKDNLLFI